MLILIKMRTILESQELDNLIKLTKRGGTMAISVRVKDGCIIVYKDTNHYRTCSGTNIIAASTDGDIIAGLQRGGNVVLYNIEGDHKATCSGTGFVSVAVSGGEIAAQKPDGSTILFYSNGDYKGQY